MPVQPSFGVLGDPASPVEAPTPESPFRIAILGDFSGRGHRTAKPNAEAVASRKSFKVTRDKIDDIVTLMKVQVKIPDLQGDEFEHTFETLEDFHPDQIHEKIDRFAFVSDEDDKSTLMAALLHHPNFQTVESAWRGVDWLLRRAQKSGNKVEVVLYDINQGEFAAALNATDDLSASPLYQLLIEEAMHGPKGQPWTLWIGLYTFDLTGADAQVLGRIGKIASHAGAPFLAGVKPAVLDTEFSLEGDAASAWKALRQLPESAMIGLALPQFLLRPPYGENTQSVERFSFEEFTKFDGKNGYLWGNAALACASLMTQSFLKDGWGFKPGSVLDLDSMAIHAYTQDDEEEVTLAEAWLSRTMIEKFVKLGLMPILSVKGRNAMQLARFCSLAQPPKDQPASELIGRWGQAGMTGQPRSAARPGMTVATSFAAGTQPAPAAPAPVSTPAPAPAAKSAATPTPAAAPVAAEEGEEPPAEEALDPELAALMAQFETPAAAPEPPAEEALDPELAALMAQFETPAESPPAAAAQETPAAEEEPLDPELAALMKQLEEGS